MHMLYIFVNDLFVMDILALPLLISMYELGGGLRKLPYKLV